MRYANYSHAGKNINNYGDQVQIITVDYLYRLMGIPQDEIVYIDKDELPSYDGEPVLLPVSMPLVDYKVGGVSGMFSEKINPIFLGLTLAKDELSPEEVSYYKAHEPVGCRDERCLDTLLAYGINCYLGGCITTLLPKREPNPQKQKKVFIIDATEGVKQYIPKEIAESAIWDTHIFYGAMDNPKQQAIKRYEQYRDEAALVITTLLHCSVPCMAMGIPVVLAKDAVSYRFAWLEALLKIYTPDNYDSIDWNPLAVEYETYKNKLRTMVFHRLQGINDANEIRGIHDFLMQRKRSTYINDAFLPLQRFIDRTWTDYDKPYQYAVWGLTQMAEVTICYINKRYPNARLCHVYDKKYTSQLGGVSAQPPVGMERFPDETVFVTTVSAAQSARDYFDSIGKPKNTYATLDIII